MAADLWMDIAKKYVGLEETPGPGNNKTVVEFFKKAGHPEVKTDSTPWCSAFVGAILADAGFVGTHSLLARSWLTWDGALKVTKPSYGDIVVFKRGSSTWEGHVAFFVREEAGYVYALGGNQSDSVCYMKFPKANVIGYRRPVEGALKQPAVKKAEKDAGKDKNLLPEITVGTSGAVAAAKPFLDGDIVLGAVVLVVAVVVVGAIWYLKKKKSAPVKVATKAAPKTKKTKK